jgi:hypothetical protein
MASTYGQDPTERRRPARGTVSVARPVRWDIPAAAARPS